MGGFVEAREIVIIGAGGFGREVADLMRGNEFAALAGFIDDDPPVELIERRGEQYLGSLEGLDRYRGREYLIGIGNGEVRQEIAKRADAAGLAAGNLQHYTATIGEDNRIGEGFVACAHVSVTTNVEIGRHVHLNLNSTVGHDTTIGDFVTVNPGVNISGNVTVGRGTMIGTGASVIQGVTIGRDVLVGAGAVVTRDVPDGVTAVGVPARWKGPPN